MKLFANGFNLYKQLSGSEVVLKNFTVCLESEVIKWFFINHSYSLIQNEQGVIIYPEEHKKIEYGSKKITKIATNNDRVLLLDETGQLIKVELSNFEIYRIVPLLELDEDERIKNIASGTKFTVAYTNKGKLFNTLEKLNFLNINIIDLQCGRDHCLLLDRMGNIYSFGIGSRGQLGHDDLDDRTEPTIIDALAGLKIVQISAGGWHSCALSQDGDVYTWGWNSNGQLGLVKSEDQASRFVSVITRPQLVTLSDSQMNVKKVAAGTRHTIILLENNHLFGCGWNKYNQLKSGEKENFFSFTYLHDFSNEDVVDLKCGPWNSAVVCR